MSRQHRSTNYRVLARFSFALALVATFALPARASDPPLVWLGGGHEDVSTIAESPDGQLIATASFADSTIKLWRAADGQLLRTLTGHIGGVHSVAFSPGGQFVVSGADIAFGGGPTAVILWSVADGSIVRQYDTTFQQVNAVAFSPDGARIAATSQSAQTFVFDTNTAALLFTINGNTFAAFSVAWSHDGTKIAVGYGGNSLVRIYNATNGVLVKTLTGHTFFVMGVAWSPDDTKLVSGSFDMTGRIWDVATGASLHTLTGHGDAVLGVAFAPDGASVATACNDSIARQFSVATGAAIKSFTEPTMLFGTAVAFTRNGQSLLTSSEDAHVRRWSLASGALAQVIGHHEGAIGGVAVSANGNLLATAGHDQNLRIWQTASGADLVTLKGHFDRVNAASFNGAGTKLASGAGSPPPDTLDPSVRIWDVATGALLVTMPGHVGGTFGVSYSPNLDFVASCGADQKVKLWDASTGQLLQTLSGHTDQVTGVEWSPNGLLIASASFDATVKVWDASTGQLVKTLMVANGEALSSVAWSADNTKVVAGGEAFGANVHVFNVATGVEIQTGSDPNGFVQSVDFSPDGTKVVSGSGFSREVIVHDVASGNVIDDFTSETGWGTDVELPVQYLPDGRLAWGRTDATLVLEGCNAVAASYGSGCAGSGAFTPSLAWSGCAAPGAPVAIVVTKGLGAAPALLFFGFSQAAIPVAGGCTLNVTPLLPVIVPFALGNAGPGQGAVTLAGAIPTNAIGASFTAQVFVIDAGIPRGFSATNGVAVTIAP